MVSNTWFPRLIVKIRLSSKNKTIFYYVNDDNKIVIDNKYGLIKIKNPWVISYTLNENTSYDYVCVTGIIIDVMLLMALGADVIILAYAIKKNKKVI